MENIEEKLIALVQVKTVLYDTSDTDYMRTRYKQQIWEEIGEELNMTGKQTLMLDVKIPQSKHIQSSIRIKKAKFLSQL
ncbi:hypothetical protein M8J77_010227 [Diaphorina citri]|nr:hypothetical protein M8J77_010227 [Diaphorina citri]